MKNELQILRTRFPQISRRHIDSTLSSETLKRAPPWRCIIPVRGRPKSGSKDQTVSQLSAPRPMLSSRVTVTQSTIYNCHVTPKTVPLDSWTLIKTELALCVNFQLRNCGVRTRPAITCNRTANAFAVNGEGGKWKEDYKVGGWVSRRIGRT